jgi:hypothetical protein
MTLSDAIVAIEAVGPRWKVELACDESISSVRSGDMSRSICNYP